MNSEWRRLLWTARSFVQAEPRFTALRRFRRADRLTTGRSDLHHHNRAFCTSNYASAPPSSSGDDSSRRPPFGVADGVYLFNPIRYIVNWYRLLSLRKNWDPQFSIHEFIDGAKQAVATVSSLIVRDDFDTISSDGLVSTKALEGVRAEVERLDHLTKPYLRLSAQEIQVAAVQRVNLQTIVEMRYADIDVLFVGTKIEADRDDSQPLGRRFHVIFVNISTRFHREYTEGVLPSWTITHLSYHLSGL